MQHGAQVAKITGTAVWENKTPAGKAKAKLNIQAEVAVRGGYVLVAKAKAEFKGYNGSVVESAEVKLKN